MKKQTAIVNLSNCKQYANPTSPFILVLDKDENLLSGLLQAAEEMNLISASLSGLGALDNVTVAYYDLNKKQYNTQLFMGMFELVSLNGNISFAENKHFVHVHAALGLPDYSVIGGHIMDATVGLTAEITVIPFSSAIHRQFNEEVGLKLMCPIPSNH